MGQPDFAAARIGARGTVATGSAQPLRRLQMRPMKKTPGPFMPLAAATIAGMALWLSRASFDVAGTTAAPLRVAMLPSFAESIGLIVMTLLLATGIALVLRRRSDQTFWQP